MPPVPKKADWPNDNRPVKPNRMSKPRPKKPPDQDPVHGVGRKAEMGQHEGRGEEADGRKCLDQEWALLEHRTVLISRGRALP